MREDGRGEGTVDLEGIGDVLEAVDRIRSCPNTEIRLLIDARSPLANRFNLELLSRSAGQLHKQVRVVTDDAGLGRVAVVAGLSVEAWSGPVTALRAVARTEDPTQRSLPTLETVGSQAWRGPAPPVAKVSARWSRKVLYGAAIGCLLAGVVLASVCIPSARVTLEAEAEAFTSSGLDVQLTPGQQAKTRADSVTQHGNATFKATGVKRTPGAQATGTVTYTNDCSDPLVVGSGQKLMAGDVEFIQQGDMTVPNRDPFTGSRPGTASAPVIAASVGTGGNVDTGHINVIEDNFEHCLTVSNPRPTSGGSDAATVAQVSQQDLDGARDQLQRDITQQITAELSRRAASGEKLSKQVGFRVVEFATDHASGDTADTFSGSMTLEVSGTFYSEDDVRRAISDRASGDIRAKRPDRMLLGGSKVDFTETTADGGGSLTFLGAVTGYLAPRINMDQIRGRIAGKPVGEAEAYLSTLPVRSHRIEQGGLWLPVMPVVGSRIDIHYVVSQGAVQSA